MTPNSPRPAGEPVAAPAPPPPHAHVVPRCMSTQHPDNVSLPFFSTASPLTPEDEVREAYYAFSELGCDEQMWDYEGKEVDEHVVEKLFDAYEPYFRAHPLGEGIFLTPRIPNPRLERTQAKAVLEVLHSLPRHSDVARLFYGRERPPVLELIYPMATSAMELDRVRTYYERFVAGMGDVIVDADQGTLGRWLGEFTPSTVRMIPLVEDREHLMVVDDIVREYARGKDLDYVRVFIARSDPALNYGFVPAVLLAMGALASLDRLERELGIGVYPIIGVGGPVFRGGLRPDTVDRCLAVYPSVQTFTVQSSFKYDHDVSEVRAGVAKLRAHTRGSALPLSFGSWPTGLLDRLIARYEAELGEVASLVNTVAPRVPRRRLRRLHVGLFGYSRGEGALSLPRAIPFCASLYTVGLPPEVLGLAALDDDDWAWVRGAVPGIEDELRDAMRFLALEDMAWFPPLARESAAAALRRVGASEPDVRHQEVALAARTAIESGAGTQVGELVLRAAALRRFLG